MPKSEVIAYTFHSIGTFFKERPNFTETAEYQAYKLCEAELECQVYFASNYCFCKSRNKLEGPADNRLAACAQPTVSNAGLHKEIAELQRETVKETGTSAIMKTENVYSTKGGRPPDLCGLNSYFV